MGAQKVAFLNVRYPPTVRVSLNERTHAQKCGPAALNLISPPLSSAGRGDPLQKVVRVGRGAHLAEVRGRYGEIWEVWEVQRDLGDVARSGEVGRGAHEHIARGGGRGVAGAIVRHHLRRGRGEIRGRGQEAQGGSGAT